MQRGLTQKQLGNAIGFKESTADVRIAQYETGVRTPKAEIVAALARVLDVSTSALTVPDIDTGSIQMKDRKHVDEARRADRLQFAVLTMIYSGSKTETVGSSMVFCDEPEEMSFIAGSDFTAVVVDIFGKEYEAELTAEQKETIIR